MLKIVYFGTAPFAVAPLAALLTQPDHWQIVSVISQADKPAGRNNELQSSPVSIFARQHQLNLQQPLKVKDETFIEQLRQLNADIFIVAAYGKILPQSILDLPRLGCLNLHGSILPKHRGASPIQQAILEGDTETGVSLMKMDAEMDHGPVYDTASQTISSDDTHATLELKLSVVAAKLLIKNLDAIADGTLTATEQSHSAATFTKLIDKENGRINWTEQTAEQIERQLRAYTPWPGIYTTWSRNGKDLRIKLINISTIAENLETQKLIPGTVFIFNTQLAIKTKHNIVLVSQLQPEGKKIMSSEAFLAGYQDIIGAALS